jgi:hypothetical protein
MGMSIEEFKGLSENEKVQQIFDAKMISEKFDDEVKYQLFQIGSFYIEARISVTGQFKRILTPFSLTTLPAEYLGEVLAIPVVSNESNTTTSINYSFSDSTTTLPKASGF